MSKLLTSNTYRTSLTPHGTLVIRIEWAYGAGVLKIVPHNRLTTFLHGSVKLLRCFFGTATAEMAVLMLKKVGKLLAFSWLLINILPTNITPPIWHEPNILIQIKSLCTDPVTWSIVLRIAENKRAWPIAFSAVLIFNLGAIGLDRWVYLGVLMGYDVELICRSINKGWIVWLILIIPGTIFIRAVLSLLVPNSHGFVILGSSWPRLV